MLFWVLYTPVLLLGVAFFLWSLNRFLRPEADLAPTFAPDPYLEVAMQPALVALEAQRLLAPALALREAVALAIEWQVLLPDVHHADDDEAFAAVSDALSRHALRLPT